MDPNSFWDTRCDSNTMNEASDATNKPPNEPLQPNEMGYNKSPHFAVRRLELLTMDTIHGLIASFFLTTVMLPFKLYGLNSFSELLDLLSETINAARDMKECVAGSPADVQFKALKETEGSDRFEVLKPKLILHFLKFIISQVIWKCEAKQGFHLFSETYDIIAITKSNFSDLYAGISKLLSDVCMTKDTPSKIVLASVVVLQIRTCDVLSSGMFGNFVRSENNVATIYLAKVSPVAFYPISDENYDANGVAEIIEFMSRVLNANFADASNCPKAAFVIYFIVSVVYGRKVGVFPFLCGASGGGKSTFSTIMRALIDNTQHVASNGANTAPYWLARNPSGIGQTTGLDSAKMVVVDELPKKPTQAIDAIAIFKSLVNTVAHSHRGSTITNSVNFLVLSNYEYNNVDFDANRRCIKIYTGSYNDELPASVTQLSSKPLLVASLFHYFLHCVQSRLQEFEGFVVDAATWCKGKNLMWTRSDDVDEFPESRRLSDDNDYHTVYRHFLRQCAKMMKEFGKSDRKLRRFQIQSVGGIVAKKVRSILKPFVSRRKLPTNELTFSFESVPATLFESIKAHTDEYEQKLRETQMSFNELQITDNATEPP